MGIKRLYSYLNIFYEEKNLDYLRDKKIGIDGMNWLYQAYFGSSDFQTEDQLSVIRLVEKKLHFFKVKKIKFFFVIDGFKLKGKYIADNQRE